MKVFPLHLEIQKYLNKRVSEKKFEKQKKLFKNNLFHSSLKTEGKKKEGWLQIDSLKIKRPKKWDGKWRIVIFDIAQLKKIYREAFRGRLKELEFYPLQKSVWIHPFECHDKIKLLRDFFGLSWKELRFIVAPDIGPDDKVKKMFNLL